MSRPYHFAFLHGGGQGGWVWEETLAALEQQMGASGYRARAFDLPGCGAKRGMDVSRLRVRDVTEIFIADLAASGLEDCVLVGHSNAGTILPFVAANRPDLVRRFVYVSCIAPAPGQSVGELMRPRHGSAYDLRQMFCNDMGEAPAAAFLARLGADNWPTPQALAETDWDYAHLADVTASYVICRQDQALPPDWQEAAATRFAVQRRVYIDAGHQVMNTQPQGLAEILRHEATA